MFRIKQLVQWSDIDPNLHLTSTAYVKYITNARMDFFQSGGYGLMEMASENIGPVVLSEKCYYFREIHPGEHITISVANAGTSSDLSKILLEQRIYNEKGKNCFLGLSLIGFLDLEQRKFAIPNDKLKKLLLNANRSKNYRPLEASDIRELGAFPIHMILNENHK